MRDYSAQEMEQLTEKQLLRMINDTHSEAAKKELTRRIYLRLLDSREQVAGQ